MDKHVISALLGENVSQPVRDALITLSDDSGTVAQLHKIVEIAHRATNVTEVSNILIAATHACPTSPHIWLESLGSLFPGEENTVEFEVGAFVGVFASLQWLHDEVEDSGKHDGLGLERFHRQLKITLPKMVFNTVSAKHHLDTLDSKLEQALKDQIKKYSKCRREYAVNRVRRIFTLCDALVKAYDEYGEDSPEPGSHGVVVIDQLCYAGFAIVGPVGRLRMVAKANEADIFNINKLGNK